jgi:hypothetical protein
MGGALERRNSYGFGRKTNLNGRPTPRWEGNIILKWIKGK